MKFSGLDTDTLCGSGPVDALLLTTCWGGAVGIGGGGGGGGGGGNTGMSLSGNDFLMDTAAHHHQKLVMDSSSNDEDSATKATMDALDNLLLSSSQNSPPVSNNNNNNNSFAELKPLPPFTGYTGHLSINGISGHHYHAIAAPQSPHSPHQQSSMVETNNNNANAANQNATSSSGNTVFKSNNATLYYTVSTTADQPVVSSSTVDGVVKSEFVDYSTLLAPDSAEDFAAIIGSVLADTTVPNVVDGLNVAGGGNNGNGGGDDAAASRDSWMDLEAWIDTACDNATGQSNNKAIISAESLQEFVASSQFVVSPSPEPAGPSSTLQNLLTQSHQQSYQMQMIKREPQSAGGYHMPLLQSRLQNGPPNGSMKPEPSYMSECPSPSSSTSYLNSKDMMMPHTTTGSPPGHVVSTTDNSLLINGRYQHRPGNGAGNRITTYGQIRSLKATGIPSPDLLVNGGSLDGLGGGVMFPHTTTASTTTPSPSKSKSRSRSNRNKQQQQQCQGAGSVVYASDGAGGLLGKEKPVHRCTVCNRGFLNKSNIKVHLRTHTGEKPFRCEVCGKAFRQKAHLLKHQQIHKRVGRD